MKPNLNTSRTLSLNAIITGGFHLAIVGAVAIMTMSQFLAVA